MSTIFISYRRDDTAFPANEIYRRLEARFGDGSVFLDVDDIPLGVDFVKFLNDAVRRCRVILVLIGPHWVGPRLEDPTDFVRIEILAAMSSGIPIVPVVLDTKMPDERELPEGLKALAHRQAVELRSGATFDDDIERLFKRIKSYLDPRGPDVPPFAEPEWGDPSLEVIPESLELSRVDLGSVESRVLRLQNVGKGGILEVSLSAKSDGWVDVDPKFVRFPVWEEVSVTADTTGLPFDYSGVGHIEATSNGGNKTIEVRLSTKADKILSNLRNQLIFAMAILGGFVCLPILHGLTQISFVESVTGWLFRIHPLLLFWQAEVSRGHMAVLTADLIILVVAVLAFIFIVGFAAASDPFAFAGASILGTILLLVLPFFTVVGLGALNAWIGMAYPYFGFSLASALCCAAAAPLTAKCVLRLGSVVAKRMTMTTWILGILTPVVMLFLSIWMGGNR